MIRSVLSIHASVFLEAPMHSGHGSLEEFIRDAPVAVAMFDRDMRYVAASRGWIESYRLQQDLRGLSHYDVFPEIPEHWKAAHRRGLAGEALHDEEEPFVRQDGTVQWLRWEILPWCDADGQVAGIVIFTDDITERKQAELSLREREERLSMAMDAAQQAPWEIDLVTGAAIPSPRLYALFGEPEVDGAPTRGDWRKYILEADRPNLDAEMRRAMTGEGQYRVQFRIRRPRDNALRWVTAFGTVRRDDTGRATRLLGVAMDVTEQKQAEEAQARLAAIVEASDDAIMSEDVDGTVWTWNRGAERLFGYTAAEIVGKPVFVLVPADRVDEEAAILARIQAGDKVTHFETVRLRKDGQPIDVSLTLSPLRDEAGRVVGAAKIARDITTRKRAEQAIQQANRRKDEFIAILSHELRNPLAPIRYALPIVQREPLGAAAARALGVVDRQVTQLTRLVDDLLDISRITSDKIELRREKVGLRSVIAAAIEASSPAISANRHALRSVVPEQEIWLNADPARVAQVVTNLLNNSAKYTPRGGEIVLEAAREGDRAVVRVRDSGIGISPEALSSVFEMFRQVPHLNKPQGGLGIGLALSKRLVEMHGGTLEAHSEGVGKGAQFTVRLPLAEAGQAPAGEAKAVRAPVGGRRLKVLVVDDNADLVEMLALLLERAGHEVRKALDGQSGLAAALAFRPDLVLLDVGLPMMSGLEVARELRRHPETASAHLVALTGWGQAHDREQTREAGFERHLTKPTDAATLEALLTEFSQV